MFMAPLDFSIQILALAIVTVLYASFDVFNKRNVPEVFAYASVALGVAITFIFNFNVLAYSLLLALIVGVLGYLVYRMGMWGAGDYFELVAISLLLPMQFNPLLVSANQFQLPFILSVFTATGFVAMWVVPIYYLLIDRNRRVKSQLDARHTIYGLTLLVLYFAMCLAIYRFYGLSLGKIALLLLIAIPSAITIIFEEKITLRMVSPTLPKELEEGDIIAINMMSKRAIVHFYRRYRNFGRLVTKKFIAESRGERLQLPVYKNAAPLAFFILIGAVVSVLFGNLILLII